MIRLLTADEIECRVQTVKSNGCSLLLYKDARCDMRILDEVFTMYGWKRSHQIIDGNLYCTVSIYDNEKKEWIDKQDVGTESMTEKEKGQSSDSFKRACFNWGIGRELYTAPFIWIQLSADEVTKSEFNGKEKLGVKTTFTVKEIGYNDKREINRLVISDSKGNIRYEMGNSYIEDVGNNVIDDTKLQALHTALEKYDISDVKIAGILSKYGYHNTTEIKVKDYANIVAEFRKLKGE